MNWELRTNTIATNFTELSEILLANRQITNRRLFFTPLAPEKLTLEDVGIQKLEMEKAVARITLAKERGEDVLIFGDYDADGICATAILWEGLREFGIVARPFIPHREKHGYGLSDRSIDAVLAEKKPDLLITVDNGIVAHAAFERLKAEGIDAILTDHHQPEVGADQQAVYPPATACIHTTQLCGSTVAWFLARQLSPKAAARSLDLTAIATIADQMPLLGVNRSFVRFGIPAIAKSSRVGLQLLIAKAAIDPRKLDVQSVNYVIAPRINAMGRLKHGLDALRLICTKNMERADQLVKELIDTNTSRQELTTEMLDDARTKAHLWEDQHIIIIASEQYHEGVIGLIAGRLTEEYSKPAIVIAIGEKVAKASARSIRGVNIIELIRLVKADLLEAGGHPMAAGFTLLPEKFEEVREKLCEFAKAQITSEALAPGLEVECIVSPDLLSLDLVTQLKSFAPFGQQNPEPVLGIKGVKIIGVKTMGNGDKHLKLGVALPVEPDSNNPFLELWSETLDCVGWGMAALAADLQPGMICDLAGKISVNEWKGRKTLQVVIKDVVGSDALK